MTESPLDLFKQNESAFALYLEGMSKLHLSGIFNVLREIGRVKKNGILPDINSLAIEASRSYGYLEALDDLWYFRERYLSPKILNAPTANWGGTHAAIARGDLEEKDLHELRKRSLTNTPDKSK